jgi:hypothetical protein
MHRAVLSMSGSAPGSGRKHHAASELARIAPELAVRTGQLPDDEAETPEGGIADAVE